MTERKTSYGSILCVAIVASFFFLMGAQALFDPDSTLDYFGNGPLGPDMRSEVRAVYGGFGIAISLLLLASFRFASLAPGIRITVAGALLGMAMGRIVSRLTEAPEGIYPLLFFFGEIILAALLLYSLRD